MQFAMLKLLLCSLLFHLCFHVPDYFTSVCVKLHHGRKPHMLLVKDSILQKIILLLGACETLFEF
jgi:hypothetical protein